MVSNARLDLPEPESPVMTISRSRGSSSEIFFRLCTRAPCTAMVVRALGFAGAPAVLPDIGRVRSAEEGQFVDVHVTPLCKPHRERSLPNQAAIGQIFTRKRHPFDPKIAPEVVLDLGRGARFANIFKVLDNRPENGAGALGEVLVHCRERGLHTRPVFSGVQKVSVDDLENGGVQFKRPRKRFAVYQETGLE